ncbi:MAG TPA: glycosyltransferase [Thermoanaerobaculia bacterium]
MSRPVLLAVGDGVVPTGFARVLHSLFDLLKDRWEIHHLAINYEGGATDLGWEVYPAGSDGDFYGGNRIRELAERVKPELVFLLNDPWVLGRYLSPLQELRGELKIVAYSPVDAGPLDPTLIEPLQALDHLVLYTEFGRREIERALSPLRAARPELPFPTLSVLPHGVDTAVFHPLPSEDGASGRLLARRELFPGPDHFASDFIVLNANRNQPRKRIDTTIRGFARFAEDKPPGVRLYLHMGLEDCGWNIVTLARRHGIEDRLIVTAMERFQPAVADSVLNRIYNACDVGINTSVGEGWGLVNLEHAATGAAQVVPRHSACEELWTGAGVLMEPAYSLTTERILTEGWVVTPEEVASALESLYRSPERCAELSQRSRAVATRADLQWAAIAERWNRLFRDVLRSGGDGQPLFNDIESTQPSDCWKGA